MLTPKVREIGRAGNPYLYGSTPITYGARERGSFLADMRSNVASAVVAEAEYAPRQLSSELLASMGAAATSSQLESVAA